MDMTNKNTMSGFHYVLDTLLWSACAFVWYQSLCFFCLPGKDFIDSKSFMMIFAIICTVAGVVLTFKNRRNRLSVMVNALFPYGVYAALSMYGIYTARVIVAVVIAAVLCAFFIFMVAIRPRRSRSRSLVSVIAFRLKHCVLGARTIVTLCALIIIIPVALNSVLGKGVYTESGDRAPYTEAPQEWTIDNKMDTVKLLKEENWGNLTIDEKLDVIAVVKNIEMSSLGIAHEIYIKSESLGGSVLGCYSPSERSIAVDTDHLRSSTTLEVVETICHECFHAYQHQQVEVYNSVSEEYRAMPMFSSAQKYAYEFENYIDGGEDFDAYYSQLSEENAREYSQLKAEVYFEKIDAWYEAKG